MMTIPCPAFGLTLMALLTASLAAGQTPAPFRHLTSPQPQEVLKSLSIASFTGTRQDSIQAVATNSSGSIYVAGTTNSAQFPVKNAEQPVFGESSILRTTDLGATWTHVGYPPGGTGALAADPVAPQVIFAIGPNGIFKSTDSGQTWQSVYPFAAGPLAIDPGNHLHIAALTSSGTLIRSLDGGVTWTVGGEACEFPACVVELPAEILADPAGSGTLLVLSLENISISRDWGLTFQSLPGNGPSAAAFDPSHPGWIYAAYAAGVSGTLYLTTDYGTTWTQKASPPPGNFSAITAIAVDPNQPSTLVAVTLGGLYMSSDGAGSWTLQTSIPSSSFGLDISPLSGNALALVSDSCSPSGGLFAISEDSGISFSPDFGITWTTPQLTNVSSISAAAGCTFYATRTLTSDAFVAKIGPDGTTLWTTYLGGSDRDAAVALTLDAQGNAYVAGNTSSPDFPVSVPHIGPRGQQSVFVAKFSPDGALIYSATLGGEATDIAIALAVDANQNAYVAGKTDSLQFPVTPGAIVASMDQGSYTGFLAKLSSNATLNYATYLSSSYTEPGAILVDANENVIIAGTGMVPGSAPIPAGSGPPFVMKLNSAASQVLAYAYVPSNQANSGAVVTGLAADSQNNLIVFGGTAGVTLQTTAGAYVSPPAEACGADPLGAPADGDAYVMKLSAAELQPVYIAAFTASCGIETGGIAIDGTGATVLAMAAGSGLSLRSPLLGAPACGPNASAIAKLSADGSTLQFATYLDNCGLPAIALAADGSVYVGVSPLPSENATSVLHFKTENSAAISLDQVTNAFSNDASTVVGGGLYSIAISGFEPPPVNLGLNPSENLPMELAGLQVKFGSKPASILATGPGRIIVAAPPVLADADGMENSGSATAFTSVQLVYNGVSSNPVWMPVSRLQPGLLTLDFPNVPPGTGYSDAPDANALNQDGTPNDANHPAAAGSTITLFVTGMGAATSLLAPGAIAHSSTVAPLTPIYSSWETVGPMASAPTLAVSSVPGFVSAVFQVQVPIPSDIQNLSGTAVGDGVMRVEVGLQLNVVLEEFTPLVSNIVAVYVD
jgi:uncharacterized protein (TIGR03437 family)